MLIKVNICGLKSNKRPRENLHRQLLRSDLSTFRLDERIEVSYMRGSIAMCAIDHVIVSNSLVCRLRENIANR